MEPIAYLKQLKKAGFSCFIVGGYVRDHLLGISSTDVDIASSALPIEVAETFSKSTSESLGSLHIKDAEYTIDITTYRREFQYSNRHPKEVEYISDIDEDLLRRDFTINAICMDSEGEIYDPLGGQKDLENGIIRAIGDIKTKFEEDPLRILRALRFAIIYDFTIEPQTLEFIEHNLHLLAKLSYTRRKEELDKILASSYATKGLRYLEQMGALEYLGIGVPSIYREVKDLIGCWVQLEAPLYPFTKIERERMMNVRKILEKGEITIETLFLYGIYDNTIAGEILGLEKQEILSLYDKMPIHSVGELEVDGTDIKNILGNDGGPIIKDIKKDLLEQVLSGNLLNSESDLSNYIRKNWK